MGNGVKKLQQKTPKQGNKPEQNRVLCCFRTHSTSRQMAFHNSFISVPTDKPLTLLNFIRSSIKSSYCYGVTFLGAGFQQQQAVTKAVLCCAVNPTLWKLKLSGGHTELPADKSSQQPRIGCVHPCLPPSPSAVRNRGTNWCRVTHTAPAVLLSPAGAPSGPGELENEPKSTSASTLHQPGAASTSDGAASPALLVSQAAREVLVP